MTDVISISDGKPAMLPPLIVVIVTSMIKDGYEDYKRHCKDSEENEATCLLLDGQEIKWKNLKVGQIVDIKDQ